MKKTVNFIFGLHSHQPVGNFESVFEQAYCFSYRPFLDTFFNFPDIKISLHYTGALFDWIAKEYPEYINKLKTMIKRGQVEMMTGAYYEPIISIIPDWDKVEQITAFSKRINEVLNVEPTGMWLAERVWEPHLPKFIKQAGVKYTVVDDSHFKSTGLSELETLGYYITEENGESIYVFPISEKMRYTIPFQPPEVTIEYLAGVATEDGSRIVVMADDGEKFGVWPDTFKHVYENKWFEKFLNLLMQNRDWINCITFSDALTKYKPIGRVYLPTASYTEMMEWVLPPKTIHKYESFINNLKASGQYEDNKIFIRGGFWRNYFAKYPESNNIHKKMLFVSEKIHSLENKAKIKSQKNVLSKAKNSLWKGQVNCGYWHGVFGGLYLPHLRKAIYDNLIEADKLAESLKHQKSSWHECLEFDFDVDGKNEVVYQSNLQNLYFKPEEGGMLIEHDFLPCSLNLIDSFKRREEGYHIKVIQAQLAPKEGNQETAESIHDFIRTKELGLEKYLNYDWYRRASLIDHFLGFGAALDNFASAKYPEEGDFVNQPYQYEVKKSKGSVIIIFSRKGAIYRSNAVIPIVVEKIVEISEANSGFIAKYKLTNISNLFLKTRFGVEFNINFQAGSAPDRYYYGEGIPLNNNLLISTDEIPIPKEFGIIDQWQGVKTSFSIDKEGTLWRFPIETVSLSEGGFERVYQSSVIFPNWNIELNPGATWQVQIEHNIEKIK